MTYPGAPPPMMILPSTTVETVNFMAPGIVVEVEDVDEI